MSRSSLSLWDAFEKKQVTAADIGPSFAACAAIPDELNEQIESIPLDPIKEEVFEYEHGISLFHSDTISLFSRTMGCRHDRAA